MSGALTGIPTASTLRRDEPPQPSTTGPGRHDRVAGRLSLVAAALMGGTAAAGLLIDDLYRDPPGVRHMLRGHDLVTLMVVVPLLLASWRAACQGGPRARLVWLGTLAFATYNYAVYAFGTRFNDLFLAHLAILEASATALVLGLLSTRPRDHAGVSPRAARGAAALLAFLAVGLGAMWAFNAVRFAVTGQAPAESELVLPLAATHLGYALDLTLIVPAYLAAAVLLWRGSPWGSAIAPVLLIGGLLQQLTYQSALVFQHRAEVLGATAFDPGEPMVIAAYVAALFVLLRRSRRESMQ